MPKYSRVKKYQDLRNRLDQETTKTQVPVHTPENQRLSRVKNNESLSHANQPKQKRISEQSTPELPKSPVMDDLIDEVKQYNLNQGTSVSEDTQTNILKQLDGSQAMHRNQHFVKMEEEDLGSTMELPVEDIKKVAEKEESPKTDNEEIQPSKFEQPVYDAKKDKGPSILPLGENPIPVQPIDEEKANNETSEQTMDDSKEKGKTDKKTNVSETEEKGSDAPTKERIVLSNEDFMNTEDTIDAFEEQEEYSRPESKRIKDKKNKEEKRKQKKVKKNRRDKKKEEKTSIENSSENAKPAKEEDTQPQPPQNKTGKVLNIILIVLVILLIAAIVLTFMMLRSSNIL